MVATAVRNLRRLWKKIFVSQSIYYLYSQMARYVVWQVEIITLSYSLNLFLQLWCSQYIFQHCKTTKAWGFLLLILKEKLSVWFTLQIHLALRTELFCFFLLCLCFIIRRNYCFSVLQILLLDCSTRGCHSPAEKRPLPQSGDLCTCSYCTQNMLFTITYKTHTQKLWWGVPQFSFHTRAATF